MWMTAYSKLSSLKYQIKFTILNFKSINKILPSFCFAVVENSDSAGLIVVIDVLLLLPAFEILASGARVVVVDDGILEAVESKISN